MVLLVSAHSAEILLLSTYVPVYFLYLFKLRFFIAKCIHCQRTIYISIEFHVNDLQKPHGEELKNAKNSSWENNCISKKWSMWMWSLGRMEQFSFQIKSRTSQQTWNRLRALKLCAIYLQSYMEFLTILGTRALIASSLRHTGQIQSLHHQNLALWPNTAFDITQILSVTFISYFEDRNFGLLSDKTCVDLLTFKCKE